MISNEKGSVKFGPWLSVLGCGSVGFIVGRVSYVSTCRDKLLERLPNSHLAQIIRNNGKVPQWSDSMDKSNDLPSESSQSDRSSYYSQVVKYQFAALLWLIGISRNVYKFAIAGYIIGLESFKWPNYA